jgi:O-antigen biosynthesis protein
LHQVFVPESLKRQNELIRTLQKQLEATERALADQKWILDQYLQSPSWRLTAPLRWIARQLRALKQLILGTPDDELIPPEPRESARKETGDLENADAMRDLKELYSSLYRTNLQAFLTSNAILEFPSTAEPKISIILVLFNRAELTFACLRSILENVNAGVDVVIVDNASTDQTLQLLDRLRGVRILRNPENRNFLLAVNQAAKEARGQFLLLLNNDAQLLPGSLSAAIETIESDETIGAVGGRIVLLDGSLQEAGSIIWRDGSCLGYGRGDNPFASTYMFRRDVDYCSGAFLLTRRSTWNKLCGFDEAFTPAYYEETDYCLRLWENGLRVVYEPSAVILHYEFASSGSAKEATSLQASHQRIFADRHSATLQHHFEADTASVLHARMRRNDGQLRVLFIDDRVPHPWLGSGFPRARTMLMALRNQGYFITLFPMAVVEEDWATVYSDLPRDVEVVNELGPTLLEAFLRNRRDYYSAIVISRPHNMKYLQPIMSAHPDWFRQTAIIYDAEALFAPRDVGLRKLIGEPLSDRDVQVIYEDEVRLAAAADCVMAVSEMDRHEFLLRGVKNVRILGHALQAEPTRSSFLRRSGFLFVGAVHEEVSPNSDSLIWFLSDIWPLIRARLGPAVTLTVAGINKSERVKELSDSSVKITGHLDDLTHLYDSVRVFIAPTRFAAGIPHKVHEAAARGVPVVATPVLARQLDWRDAIEFRVAEDPTAFAESCIDLHENESAWTEIRENALDAIRRQCSPETFEDQFNDILNSETLKTAEKRYADAGMDR